MKPGKRKRLEAAGWKVGDVGEFLGDETILEEIHRIRREIAAEFNGDVHALFAYLRERERADQDAHELK